MKMQRIVLGCGWIILGLIIFLNSALAQVQVMTAENVATVLPHLREYNFEELPPNGHSCYYTYDPFRTQIPNPLIYDRLTITNSFCMESGFCSSPTCEAYVTNGPNGAGNLVIVLTSGSTVTFPYNPRYVVFDTQGNGDNSFLLRATDASGATADVPGQAIIYNRVLVGVYSPVGISRVELVNVGGTGGPLAFAGIFIEAPPLAPFGLRAVNAAAGSVQVWWTNSSPIEHLSGYVVERKTGIDGGWEEIRRDNGRDVTGIPDDTVAQGTRYYYRVKVFNWAGDSPYSNEASVKTLTETTVTFVSVPAHDGFVVERAENLEIGGFVNSTADGLTALLAGDSGHDQQVMAFVSFNTAEIPDNARLISAKLRLKRGKVIGKDPFLTHGPCFVEIKGGKGFSNLPRLQASDFEAPSNYPRRFMSLINVDGGISELDVHPDPLQHVNRAGFTQFRVFFGYADNDDGKADMAGWCSGEHPDPANRPTLEVTYWVK